MIMKRVFFIPLVAHCFIIYPAWGAEEVRKEDTAAPLISNANGKCESTLKITPTILTVNSKKNGEAAKTTPGLQFCLDKPFGGNQYTSPNGFTGGINASGQLAFDQNQNVGDLVDLNVNYSYQYNLLSKVNPITFAGGPWGFFNAGFKAGIQTNQSFDTKQKVVAFETRGFYTPNNLGFGLNQLPPILVFGYERVDPSGDVDRAKADPGLSAFNRLHGSLSSTVAIGAAARLEFKIDHWRELSPSQSMTSANLDRQTYRAICLHVPAFGNNSSWLVMYSSGKVPTDKTNAQVWQLGYTFSGNL
jgi:hypothetical protein